MGLIPGVGTLYGLGSNVGPGKVFFFLYFFTAGTPVSLHGVCGSERCFCCCKIILKINMKVNYQYAFRWTERKITSLLQNGDKHTVTMSCELPLKNISHLQFRCYDFTFHFSYSWKLKQNFTVWFSFANGFKNNKLCIIQLNESTFLPRSYISHYIHVFGEHRQILEVTGDCPIWNRGGEDFCLPQRTFPGL